MARGVFRCQQTYLALHDMGSYDRLENWSGLILKSTYYEKFSAKITG
jgi:hypothetical protein